MTSLVINGLSVWKSMWIVLILDNGLCTEYVPMYKCLFKTKRNENEISVQACAFLTTNIKITFTEYSGHYIRGYYYFVCKINYLGGKKILK